MSAVAEVIDPGRVRLGVAAPDPFIEVRDEIARRDGSGERGSLGFVYRDPDTATDPRRSFPWARSIVVAAVGYLRDGDGTRPGPHDERTISRFADGDRYDDLRRVLERIRRTLADDGHRAEAVFDDDRLVDRALAVRSGIAWWGKSTMAITPGLGPWFLIGSVVTDARLEASRPMERSCGTCTACLPACPTGAIVSPGILDARRCLAAVFQSRGAIPLELRPLAGERVYGCDDCLTACPPGQPWLSTFDAGPATSPLEILRSTDVELLDRFDHWYIPGRHTRFVRRNALVALGNSGGDDALGVLAGYLGHPDSLLRRHAAWAAGAIGGRVAVDILDTAADIEADDDVLAEIESARIRAMPQVPGR